MNKKTLKALKESIKKWEKIVSGEGEDRGGENCALCEMFAEDECIDCPVYIKTGEHSCGGTPYIEWRNHQSYHLYTTEEGFVVRCSKCKELAQRELEFLKSLLPEKRQKRKKEKVRKDISISLIPHSDDVSRSEVFEVKEKIQQSLDELGVGYIFQEATRKYEFILKNDVRETVFHSLLTTIRAVTLGREVEAIISYMDEEYKDFIRSGS